MAQGALSRQARHARAQVLISDAELAEQADEAAASGYQLAIHAIGDAANAQVITALRGLDRRYKGDRRWRIEHVQVADPADLPRLKPAGIIASMQPTHQTSDRTMAEARLDPPRLGGRLCVGDDREARASGSRSARTSRSKAPTPSPASPPRSAGRIPTASRRADGGREERVSFATALGGFTRGAAYAGFAEDKIGSLEPGKWADFILVDRDVTKVDPQALAATKVLETWVAGKKVFASAGAPPAR